MKPPISYYGGKQRMAKYIVPLIPRHTVYVEPFAGGAAVMFAKPLPDVAPSNYIEYLNDTDQRLVNFYRVLRDNGEELIRRLQLTPYSEQEHRDARGIDADDPVERARQYFVAIQQSIFQIIGNTWAQPKSGNHAISIANKVDLLPELLVRMRGVHLACKDALRLIRQLDSPSTFFYCDPPYPGTDQGHYSGYTSADFAALVDTLRGIKGSFILSNYDQPNVPPEWERHEFAVTSSAGVLGTKDRRRTEVVWRHVTTEPLPPRIEKLYATGKYDVFDH